MKKTILLKIPLSIALLLLLLVTTTITHSEPNDDLEWSLNITITENSGSSDTILIGESINASDGYDGYPYDAADPGSAPSPPYLNAYLQTDFTYPNNNLMQEIKHYDPSDEVKMWNLTILWFPADYTSPTNITLTWNLEDALTSGYEIQLYSNGSPILDMNYAQTYTYTSTAMQPKNLIITCQREPNKSPDQPKKPNGIIQGYHGQSYTYQTSANDTDNNSLYYLFDWNDGTNSGWIGPHSSGELCNSTHLWQTPGVYQIRTKARDQYGAESNWSTTLQINMTNQAPNTPTNPYPSDSMTGINIDTELSWTGGDPDLTDVSTYDIYFGENNPPPKIISNTSSAIFEPGTMNYNNVYYWRITAWDEYGLKTTGQTWSFTTKSSDNGANNGNQPPPMSPENIPPIADASASENSGLKNSTIRFNGSRSIDPDGYITSWLWDFGDNTTGTGEITIHRYSENGIYFAKLTVTDNFGATNTSTIQIRIITANNPPSPVTVNGISSGQINVTYTFTALSIDQDNDTISYTFDWGDGNSTTTDFLENGETCIATHTWTYAGIFEIIITATDNVTSSNTNSLIVFINAEYVGNLGYLLDNDNDTIYDSFYSNATKQTTATIKDGNNYLIDNNGDGRWDYSYNPLENSIEQAQKENSTARDTKDLQTKIIVVCFVISIMVLLSIYLIKKRYS